MTTRVKIFYPRRIWTTRIPAPKSLPVVLNKYLFFFCNQGIFLGLRYVSLRCNKHRLFHYTNTNGKFYRIGSWMQDNLPKGCMVDPLGSANRPWLRIKIFRCCAKWHAPNTSFPTLPVFIHRNGSASVWIIIVDLGLVVRSEMSLMRKTDVPLW